MNATPLRHFHNLKLSNGFSLLEIMVALAVFSVGLLAIFSMQFSAIRTNAVARGVTENITVATAKVEQLMALPFDHADLAPGLRQAAMSADGIDNNLNGAVDEPGESGYLQIEWNVVDNCLGATFDGHKCVQVHVSSTVNGDRQKEIRLDFIKAQYL
jgi:type IV pilus assembly protein PilV